MTLAIRSFSGPHRFLSNFWPSPIEIDGLTYPTVEHAYQASKTVVDRLRVAVCGATSPGNAKRMGQQLPLRADWENIKLDVMKSCLRAKFAVDPLRQMLLDTRDAHLEEGNLWKDVFYGTFNGVGLNHLGRMLMEVRSELVAADAGKIAHVNDYPLKAHGIEILFADNVRGWSVDYADSEDFNPIAVFAKRRDADAFVNFLRSEHCPEDMRTSADLAVTAAFVPRVLTSNSLDDKEAVNAMVSLYGGCVKSWIR